MIRLWKRRKSYLSCYSDLYADADGANRRFAIEALLSRTAIAGKFARTDKPEDDQRRQH